MNNVKQRQMTRFQKIVFASGAASISYADWGVTIPQCRSWPASATR